MSEDLDTRLRNKTHKQVIFFALAFGLFFMAILTSPLLVYHNYMTTLYQTKLEYELNEQSKKIISQMDSFDNKSDKYFYFPRFKQFQAGLYDSSGKPIFTTIKHYVDTTAAGIKYTNAQCYLVCKLPSGHYFGSDYLVVSSTYDTSEILSRILFVATGILILVFGVSWFLFLEFEKPYKKANQMMDDFVVNTMHELNTPLSIVLVNSEILEEKYGENKHLDRIKAAVQTLATIYDDMDYIVKNERLEYVKETINVSAFLESRAQYFDTIAKTKNIVIEREIDDGLSVEFNHVKLQRIVDNTLSNALKYSKDDSGCIIVRLFNDSDGVVFECEDFGIGIEKPEEIFDRYYREDGSKGGFGIGLNIVKAICDEDCVCVEVDSVFGRGSVFRYLFVSQVLDQADKIKLL